MDPKLYFTQNDETFYFVGRPADYFYDFGMMPIAKNACTNVLEKNRFLVALHQHFTTFDPRFEKTVLPSELIKDLNFYFNEFESFSLSHWNLLKYETINEAFANEDFPNLFMSEKQQNENLFCLNNYFNKVIQIFSKYSIQINSCEKLLEYYLDNHTV